MASCGSCGQRRAKSKLQPTPSTAMAPASSTSLAYALIDDNDNEIARYSDSGEARKAWIAGRKKNPDIRIIQVIN